MNTREHKYRGRIARELAGGNVEKAKRIRSLPLFRVAVDGRDGMAVAIREAQTRKAA